MIVGDFAMLNSQANNEMVMEAQIHFEPMPFHQMDIFFIKIHENWGKHTSLSRRSWQERPQVPVLEATAPWGPGCFLIYSLNRRGGEQHATNLKSVRSNETNGARGFH